ncbi:MAG TPA: PTS sugar transporter subunit IIB [Gemmatimonadaceae bacterium]|nr:PTS sugar transporter subunit IIB [Gemmatimonadaceae bacterium]
MPVALYRIDDRLIHGQVVVGWGQPLGIQMIVLVDDNVASSDWEQDLYRMGVPPEMEISFPSVETAIQNHESYAKDRRQIIIVTGDILTMHRLVTGTRTIREVNVGGIHHRPGRTQRMRYVFLTADEETQLRALVATGAKVTAQDVPTARAIPIEDVLARAVQESAP